MSPSTDAKLELRLLTPEDYEAVVAVQEECYPGIPPWRRESYLEQLRRFPEGQACIALDGEVVATSSSLIVAGDDWEQDHTFGEVSANGTIRSHDEDGDTLYGIDIAVRPMYRGRRFARRLYDYRKMLIQRRNLRRLFIAGRLPGLHAHPDLTAEEYVREVLEKTIQDPVLTTQLANGFYIVRVLSDYLPSDDASRGHAVLMEWLNPEWMPEGSRLRTQMRVSAVQYGMRSIASWDEFAKQCGYYADLAADNRADFLCFPELLTNQLIPLIEPMRPGLRVRQLDRFTQDYVELFTQLAIRNNVNIIGGTHLVVEDDTLYNVAYLFHRDGRVDRQYKLHVTPDEARWWGVTPGDQLDVFDTDCGRVAILICYDVEFPELARVAKAKGANVLFVPYNTDLPTGHTRVRTCAHARCIENNVYVVLAGMCGGLPTTDWAEIHYARSAILTPSDVAFPREGIAAEASDNRETLIVQDLNLSLLRRMQRLGQVRTWMDRRTDLYRLKWTSGDESFDID